MARIILAMLLIGCAGAASVASIEPEAEPARAMSEWGPLVRGMKARFEGPASVEQNMPIAISFTIAAEPNALPAGVTKFNATAAAACLRLTLTNIKSAKTFDVNPWDPLLGMPLGRAGEPIDLSNGKPIDVIHADFPLREAGAGLVAGEYECVIDYSSDRSRRAVAPDGARVGEWRGNLRTSAVRMTLTPEMLKPLKFQIPRRLTLTADETVVFDAHDAEQKTVEIGNGMFTGTRITRNDRGEMTLTSSTPMPDGFNPIDSWKLGGNRPATGTASYTVEVFETANRPQHMWRPSAGSGDYKTLWTGTFEVGAGKK